MPVTRATVPLRDGTRIEYETSVQMVYTSGGTVPDPDWTYTDTAGHLHYCDFNGSYPTLEAVRGEPYWCESCGDDHEDFEGYRCRLCLCGEVIEPGTKHEPPGAVAIAGPMSVTRRGTLELPAAEAVRLYNDRQAATLTQKNGRTYVELNQELTQAEAKRLAEQIGLGCAGQ